MKLRRFKNPTDGGVPPEDLLGIGVLPDKIELYKNLLAELKKEEEEEERMGW